MTEIGEAWELIGFRQTLLALAETGEKFSSGKVDRLIGEMEGRFLAPRGIRLKHWERRTMAAEFRARVDKARMWRNPG